MLLALACVGGFAASAYAATYTVGTTEDTTGICEFPESGTCSLRQLITYENSLAETPSPPDTIDVPAHGGSTFYDLSNGPLTIFKSVSIAGAGARHVSVYQFSEPANRVFFIEPNPRNKVVPTVVISGLSIVFGHANANNEFFGGDVLNRGTLTLSEDAITNGSTESGSGAGISNDGGTMTVTHSLVSDNFSNGANGGGDSGGIQNYGPNPVTGAPGALIVYDSTITGNAAALGGGVFSWGDKENTTKIVNSTIANNDGGTRSTEGGGLLTSQGTIEVENSIVAENTVEDPATGTASNCGQGEGIEGSISSRGYNLESATDCGFTATGDLQNTDPQFIAGLQDNGGDTDTFALKGGSPAVDAIPANAPFCKETDQRGIARPQGTGCDIGAFELLQPVEGQQFSEVVGAAGARETPTIEWGDGTKPSPAAGVDPETGEITGTHAYAEAGVYHANFKYLNSDGFPESRPFDVKVQDAPLSATATPVATLVGVPFTGPVATFTDANPDALAADFTATIGWGDGVSSTGTVAAAPGGGFTVTGSHTYTSVGTYQTNIRIADSGGATATAIGSAEVTAPPPPSSPAPPTLLATSPPSVLSTTSAVFTATVNPHGLPTTIHFEYGGVFGGASIAAVTYGSSTPGQAVPADFADHTVTSTVTGLLPNVLYHVRAVATNSAGSAQGADQVLTTPADPPPPPPVLGKSVNVTPVSGIVYVELPPGAKLSSLSPPAHGSGASSPFALFTEAFAALTGPRAFTATGGAPARAALTKGNAFIPLTEARQIPVDSILDTTRGVVGITTATTAAKHGKLQTGDFGAGLFKLLQGRHQRGLTNLDIINTHSARALCASTGKAHIAAAHPSSKVLGRLNASGHGHFSARGQYSAATVRGTIWSVANQCNGTLTRVKRGVISVRDFRRRRTFTLFTGQSYLARAPLKRG